MIGLGLGLSHRPVSSGGAAAYATTSETSVTIADATYGDVTFNFSTSVNVGWFTDLNGNNFEPFVVSDQAFTITSITPAASNASGAWANGAVVDPFTDSAQGFDEWIGNAVTGSGGQETTTYTHALNVDPGATAAAYSVSVGDNKTIVKTTRLGTATSGSWQIIGAYKALHIVSEAPTSDKLAPAHSEVGVSGTLKSMISRNSINLSKFRDIALPAAFTATPTTAAAKVPPWHGHFGSSNPEKRRRFRLDNEYNSNTTTLYSGHIVQEYTDYLIVGHDNATTDAERRDIAHWAIVNGQQLVACVGRGGTNNITPGEGPGFDAGQGACMGIFLWYMASLTGSADLLSTARTTPTQTTNGPYWMKTTDVDTVGSAGLDTVRDDVSNQTHFDEHVGMPGSYPEEKSTNYDGRYTPIGHKINYCELLAVLYLTDGYTMLAEGATVNDTADENAARLAWMDRARTWEPYPTTGTYDVNADYEALLDQVRPLISAAAWTGVPDQIPYTGFTFGDGQASWDISSYEYYTEAPTQTDFRYSLDGYQWVIDTDVGDTSSKTGLLKGVSHFVGLRRQSASGAGVWTKNQPRDVDEGAGETINDLALQVNYDATTGTATAAVPVNTVAPVVLTPAFQNWGYDFYESTNVSGTTFDTTATELIAGVGYYTGYPAPTFTYQWKKNGTNISGATSKTIAVDSSWVAGDTISCVVTATNASGAINTETTATTVPTFIVRFIDNTGAITTSGSTVNIGNPSSNRHVLAVFGGYDFPNTAAEVTALTIAGQSCSRLIRHTGGWAGVEVWVTDAPITTGTTGTMSWTLSKSTDAYGWFVHEFNTTNTTPADTDSQYDPGTDAGPLSFTLNVPAGSFVLQAAQCVSGVGGSGITSSSLAQFYEDDELTANEELAVAGEHRAAADAAFASTMTGVSIQNDFVGVALALAGS